MNTVLKYKSLVSVVVALAITVGLAFLWQKPWQALGEARSGSSAIIATSSPLLVTTTAKTAFATSTCTSRIITTAGFPIRVTLSDYANQTPTLAIGHWQAASTTKEYDSGLSGCGKVKVWSQGSQTIWLTETI